MYISGGATIRTTYNVDGTINHRHIHINEWSIGIDGTTTVHTEKRHVRIEDVPICNWLNPINVIPASKQIVHIWPISVIINNKIVPNCKMHKYHLI